MPVSSEFFLTLVRSDFLSFSLSSAGHVGTPFRFCPVSMHIMGKSVKSSGTATNIVEKNPAVFFQGDSIVCMNTGYSGY